MRCLFLLAMLGALAADAAAETYEEILRRALRVQREVRPGDEPTDRFNRAYKILAEAVMLDSRRPDAYVMRITNRVDAAVLAEAVVRHSVDSERARGADDARLKHVSQAGALWRHNIVSYASKDLVALQNVLRQRRSTRDDANLILFCRAAIMGGAGDYERGPKGGPGAIATFKKVAARGFRPKLCYLRIAMCYLDLGVRVFTQLEAAEAQVYWDKALKYAKRAGDRRLIEQIYSNKAGGYEMDNDFVQSEEILREQIGRDPDNAENWKNLGLILGFQHQLKEALHAYRRCREICVKVESTISLAKMHGNAWLRAAAIHGKLLAEDGDVHVAWRLFLEYRLLFGDDYNFSMEFGQFAAEHGAYDVAWRYLTHARDLQPHCPHPYQILQSIAPRVPGTPEEARARIKKANEEQAEAFAKFDRDHETPTLQRVCGGLHDWADGLPVDREATWLDPDPLAGFGSDAPPPWVEKAAGLRDPFVPWTPGAKADDAGAGAGGAVDSDVRPAARLPVLPLGLGVVALLGATVLLFRRRTRPA